MGWLSDALGAFNPFSAGATLLGGMMSNESNEDIASANNAFNAHQAQINRDWQERMANTSHQRQVKDLAAAGLNPMLGYMKGSGGAAVPGGSAATSSGNPTMKDTISPAVASAYQVQQMQEQTENLKATNDQLKAQTGLILAQQRQTDAQTARVNYELYGDDSTGGKGNLFWQIQEMKQRIDLGFQQQLTEAQRYELVKWDRNLREVQVDLEQKRLGESEARARLLNADAKLSELDIPRMKNEARINESEYGTARPLLNDIGKVAGSAAAVGLRLPSRHVNERRLRVGRD